MNKRVYRTAQGRMIDIDSLRIQNEDVIAVGNMKVNARGDELGPGGKVVTPRSQRMSEYYDLKTPTVMDAPEVPVAPAAAKPAPPPIATEAERVLEVQDEVLPGAAAEPSAAELRGSLADSIAKSVSVKQELLKPASQQAKSRGPSRI